MNTSSADPLSPNNSRSFVPFPMPKSNFHSPPQSVATSKISPEIVFSPNSTFLKELPVSPEKEEDEALLRSSRFKHQAPVKEENKPDIMEFLNLEDSGTRIEHARLSKTEFQKLLAIDLGTALMACVGGFLTILAYDLEFEERDQDTLKALLGFIFASTIITILFNAVFYAQNIKYLKTKNILLKNDNIFTTGKIWGFSIETFLLLLQPYFFLQGIRVDVSHVTERENFYYYVNDFFSILAALRIFFVLRFLLNMTLYRSPRSQRLAAIFGTTNGYLYSCRCLMERNAFIMVGAALGIGIIILGYMLRICERPIHRSDNLPWNMDFGSYWNSMWNTIITITTVGYGDYFARTIPGRIVILLGCLGGTSLVALAISTLTKLLAMDPGQMKVCAVLERLELRKQIKNESAFVLTNMAKIRINAKKIKDEKKLEKENKVRIKKIRDHLSSFKQMNRQISMGSGGTSLVEEMDREAEFFRDEMKDIRDAHNVLEKDIERLKNLAIMLLERRRRRR